MFPLAILPAALSAVTPAAATAAAGSGFFASLFSSAGLQAAGLVLAGVGTLANIQGTKAQLAAQRDQIEYTRRAEATDAARRDAERQKRLRQVLSTNIAAAASAGLDIASPSVLSLSEQSAREAAHETNVDRENVLANAGMYDLQIAGLGAQGRASATAGLFSAGRDFMGALAQFRKA